MREEIGAPRPRRPHSSIHVLAAVDPQRRAGDERARVRGEEGYAAGDFLGLAQATDRDFGDDLLQHVLGHGGDHVRIDIARGDRVHGDAVARAFLRQRLGKSVDAAFRRGIVDLAVLASLPIDRADIDDAAPLPHPSYPRKWPWPC